MKWGDSVCLGTPYPEQYGGAGLDYMTYDRPDPGGRES